MCERNPNSILLNVSTGEELKPGCNTYSCPECGPRKARKLAKFLKLYLQDWKHIRFWTFTMSNQYHETPEEHYKAVQEVWRRFITYLRRSKALRKKTQGFSYVRVIELHKTGYVHLHCFFSEYLPWDVVNPIWENLCSEICETKYKPGSTYVKGLKNAGFVAYYVSKYVAKSLGEIRIKVRRWSTSYGVKIFPEVKISGEWVHIWVKTTIGDALTEHPEFVDPYLVTLVDNFTGRANPPPKALLMELFSESPRELTEVENRKHEKLLACYPKI